MAKDYILRLIEQVAMMLAQIVAKRKGGDLVDVRNEIEDQALQHSGLPLSVIRNAAPEMVADLLRSGGELRFIRSILLAELLIQDAEVCEETGDKSTALVDYVHAWRLLHDSIEAFNADERKHFGAKQEQVAARLNALSRELDADLSGLLPASFYGEPSR